MKFLPITIIICVLLTGCLHEEQPGAGDALPPVETPSNSVSSEQPSEEVPVTEGKNDVGATENEMPIDVRNLRIEGNPGILPGIWFDSEQRLIYAPANGGASYPRLFETSSGTVLAGFDTNEDRGRHAVKVIISDDMENWSDSITVGRYDNLDCANLHFIEMDNGDILAAYRANENLGNEPRRDGYYSSIRCSISRDGGQTWEFHSIIAEEVARGGVYEPHFGRIDGQIAIFYANDSWNVVNKHMEQNLEFKLMLPNGGWSEKYIASDGTQTHSRDGMPVWDRSIDGSYVLVAEATNVEGYPFVIQLKRSPDGIDWSASFENIYIPYQKTKKAGAPYILTLPDGRFAVSFQTDDDKESTGDGHSYMKVMLSLDETAAEWTQPYVPFLIPEAAVANWNSLFLRGDRLYAATSASYPQGGLFVRGASLTPSVAQGSNIVNNGMFIFANTQNWYFEMGGNVFHNDFPAKKFESRVGNHYLTLMNNTQNDISLRQQIPGAAEGSYMFSVRAMGDGAQMLVVIAQGSESAEFLITPQSDDALSEYVQEGIWMQDGMAELSITMVGGTGKTLSLDDVALIKE